MGMLKNLELDYDLDVVEDFVSNFEILCENIEIKSMELSRSQTYKDSCVALYDGFRNTKYAATYFGLSPVEKLAFLCENKMKEAMDLEGEASDEFVDWLILAGEQLAKYHRDLLDDKEYFGLLDPSVIKIPHQILKHTKKG